MAFTRNYKNIIMNYMIAGSISSNYASSASFAANYIRNVCDISGALREPG
jgi:hypothetical protein